VALRAVDIAGPWKVVGLVRLGPSPYAAMNYIFVSPRQLLACPGVHLREGVWQASCNVQASVFTVLKGLCACMT
jgi:hypothetical protein